MEIKNENPWEPIYRRMEEELPQNDTEREILQILGKGGTICECRDLWVERGFKEDEFLLFLKKAEDWETANLCSP